MPKIKNMGTATMRFSEGAILTGSAGTDTYTLVVSGSTRSLESLTVEDNVTLKELGTAPGHTSNYGKLYVLADNKLYFKDDSGTEYDLTAGGGGGGGGLEYALGHVDVTTNGKPVNWINAAAVSAANAIKTWFIVPKATTLDKVIVSVNANNFSTSNDGNITLDVYKNQANFGSTIVNQTAGADDFTEKVSNMGTSVIDCNQKIFSGLNQSLAEGDLIQAKVSKSAGVDVEALVTLVFSTSSSSGGESLSVTDPKTSAYTASNWEFVLVNLAAASGDVTVTLPAASADKQVAIKINSLAMGREVIVDGNGSETIDGLTTRTLNTDYESIHLISDGNAWWRIS